WLKASLAFPKLPEMRRELQRLKRELDSLKAALNMKDDGE
ncbi:MAG: UDP-3-O-(3-hydroxymyristoyl)glucosamine N-acyltransferase, partial [Deltaproteobacteria bacterium]